MTKTKWMPDPGDVAKAVEYLENALDLDRSVYRIGRISNTCHAIDPRGEGFGIAVSFWFGKDALNVWQRQEFWEKAGEGRSCYEAARTCVGRLTAFWEQLSLPA